MTRSSPAGRRSQIASPDRGFLSRFLGDDRNTEDSHRDALAAAQLEHERVREAALRVFQLHELQEEHKRILEAERREQERLRAEAAIAAEEQRLRALRAKSVPKPPPEPETPKQPEPPKQPAPTKETAPPKAQPSAPVPAETNKATTLQQSWGLKSPTQQQTTSTSPFTAAAPKQNEQQKSPLTQANGVSTAKPAPSPAQPPTAPKQPTAAPAPASSKLADRYLQIHQELKNLRKNMIAESKKPGSPLKGRLGAFRREIQVSIGQLTAGRGANTKPIGKITEILKQALQGAVPSPPIDVSVYVVDTDRQPAEGAPNNDATLPSLFLYLLNICSKAVINQYINEGGANPKAADPVGVFAAHVFSTKEFQWRGKPLVDILIAKFRVVCPVLFGLRGNDKTERGRMALGWKKDGPAWITEQNHNDRMTGLGAGFASLSLRDFSKTTKSNPYPPTNYWKAMAGILNTPANETSNTQYVVLRSMIEGHEQRFLNFYGNAALAALRLALIEFPKKAPANAAAAGSLQALTEVLRGEGLILV